MCGPSGAQKDIAGQQQTLGTTLAANYQNNYAAQGNILKELNDELTPIAQAGPDQQGYGANERAALQTADTTGVATSYNKAATALGMSTRGSVPAGAARAYQQQLATNAAKTSAQLQNRDTINNYNTGRANFGNAVAGVNALAKTYDPNDTAKVAGGSLNQAYGAATQSAQAGYQEFGEIAAGVAGLGQAAASGYDAYKNRTPPSVQPQQVNIGDPINMGTYQVPQLSPLETAPMEPASGDAGEESGSW